MGGFYTDDDEWEYEDEFYSNRKNNDEYYNNMFESNPDPAPPYWGMIIDASKEMLDEIESSMYKSEYAEDLKYCWDHYRDNDSYRDIHKS